MKKNLLLMMLCCPAMLAAQNGVTVSNLTVDAGTVTFNVQWTNDHAPGFLWSDTVWVFVDYNNKGVMERLPLLPGATLTATSPGGKVIEETDNNKGVWIAGNARTAGSFSATVKLLTSVSNVGGACAYGSNYPPVGEYKNNATEISFTGTPMYEISLTHSDGGTAIVKSGDTLLLPCDYTLTSFTDATGAPGRFNCISPAVYILSGSDICVGTDVTLTLSDSESGWRYQLYKDNIAVGNPKDGTGGALPFTETSPAAGRFKYMVRTVDATGAQCEIAASNVLAITINPVSAIYRNGGNASQTVNQNIAITAMTYTASNAATIAMTGDFPEGINGNASGSSYTISGTPTIIGMFGYTLIAAVGSCTSTAAVGAFTVIDPTQPIAASTQTWTYGAQTWSDRIVATPVECIQTDALTTTDFTATEYLVNDGRVYYTGACVIAAQTTLCPSPWRAPTVDDLRTLKTNASDLFPTDWGMNGIADSAAVVGLWYCGRISSITKPTPERTTYYCRWERDGEIVVANTHILQGNEVRCVKP